MAAVEVEDLVIRYGPLTAVDGLSFSAEAGKVTAVLGPNGAGKTSTIECLEGYRKPSAGRVRVVGLDPQRQHGELVSKIGVMLQDGGVYTGIRAREVVELFCALYGHRHHPDELLELVGLADRAGSTWRRLSGGEQRRLSLALALTGDPEVAFLDEPTSGVDVGGRQVVRQVIRSLAEGGAAVLLTTHELAEAERVADRVVIIDRGKLVAAGTPTELMTSGDQIRFGAEPGLDVAALGAALGAVVQELTPGDYTADAKPDPANVAKLTAWLAERNLSLRDLRAGRHSLEDVFLRLTKESG
ncbi:MAG: ABC transporter ATP-binding protein [Acidimicrobiia bacterium]